VIGRGLLTASLSFNRIKNAASAAFFVFMRQPSGRFVTPENFCFYFRQLKSGLQDMTRASLSNERARGLIPVGRKGSKF
jgi:hypothetical protein